MPAPDIHIYTSSKWSWVTLPTDAKAATESPERLRVMRERGCPKP